MSRQALIGSLIVGGLFSSILGIELNFQTHRFSDLVVTVVGLGLIAALIGGTLWAYRAPVIQLVLAGGIVALIGFSLTKIVDINVHGDTVVFLLVILACILWCFMLLLIGTARSNG